MIQKRISYNDLNAKQKEAFNYQKLSAILADYGYITIKLSDDWNGADLIAQHCKDNSFLKIQLKGRITFDVKYQDKDLYLAFKIKDNWYLAPYDQLFKELPKSKQFFESESWKKGTYSFPKPSKTQMEVLFKYQL